MSTAAGIWAIIPVKRPGEGKVRLAGALDAHARAALVDAMLGHVIATVRAAAQVGRVVLLGEPRAGMTKTEVLADPGGGLNAALQCALACAADEGASRVLIVPADLPRLGARDIEAMALVPAGAVAIAPDRHGIGTNGLSLPLPEAEGFVFAFGADSFARHGEETARLGLKLETVHSPGWASDVDLPEDLPDAAVLTG